jgi:deoxyribodipyrimidine photolyase-related protein
MAEEYNTLRLVLGDQLNTGHSWFQKRDRGVLHVLAELRQETDYVRHHVQKICAFFAAMEAFADTLRRGGHNVRHLTLDDTRPFTDLEDLLAHLCERHGVKAFEYQRPDEYRLVRQLRGLKLPAAVTVKEADTEHFLLPWSEIPGQFPAKKHHRMETFYRGMRRRFDILLDEGEPVGGRWNFDRENRQPLTPEDIVQIPEPLVFDNDAGEILERLDRHGVAYFGERTRRLIWPVDRSQSLKLLDHFCTHCLPNFGRFQDAMTVRGDHRWSLYHSRLSFALNSKMLGPREVIDRALERFEAAGGAISPAQIEGFVRQVLGWREFVRGVYWAHMPQYARTNRFRARRRLPEYFWTGRTNMTCMVQVIDQSLRCAYAHHIQRLMVTGNFCLLAGIHPDEVDRWYLGVYVDAIEWVEMPNTRGMSQFADGGLVASKPYAAGGNYINRMSDYCADCFYDVREKTGDKACPFNSLFWRWPETHASG